ncbi:MAG: hypothetical protein KC636_36270 [Myxococcales bacterium]|nr:hypothetical protein [Myxococcales bacterium]
MTSHLRRTSAVWAGLLTTSLVIAGCSREDPATTVTDSGTTDESTDSDSSTSNDTTAGPTSSSTDTTMDPTTTTTDPTTTTTDGGSFLTTSDSDSDSSGGPQPNGSACSSDAECESGICYMIPMIPQGFCSECQDGDDCPDDKPSCSIDILQMSAVCTAATLGAQCDNDAVCQSGGEDYYCKSLIPGVEFILPQLKTCGECGDDGDCDAQICNPFLDINSFGGYYECVDPGSVANNELCSSDEACSSGHCDALDTSALGLPIPVNACGECSDDSDCMGNQTCQQGALSMMGFSGSICVA